MFIQGSELFPLDIKKCIGGSYSSSIFNFLGNLHAVFSSGWSSLFPLTVHKISFPLHSLPPLDIAYAMLEYQLYSNLQISFHSIFKLQKKFWNWNHKHVFSVYFLFLLTLYIGSYLYVKLVECKINLSYLNISWRINFFSSLSTFKFYILKLNWIPQFVF